jgi:hypothetical protein
MYLLFYLHDVPRAVLRPRPGLRRLHPRPTPRWGIEDYCTLVSPWTENSIDLEAVWQKALVDESTTRSELEPGHAENSSNMLIRMCFGPVIQLG